MTRDEFMHGWALLTAQPWGRIYDGRLEPEKAQIQFELYYERLAFASPQAWIDTVKLFAGGSEWPPLNDLRQSLSGRHQHETNRLPAPRIPTEIDMDTQRKAEATISRLIGKPFTFPKT